MSSSETRGDPIIIRNAKQDPSYCPYCMRCSGLVRMRKVEDFYWRCRCGAEHDERANVAAPATPSTGRERETELEPLRSHYRMALEDVPGKAAHRAIAAYVDALEAALATPTPSPTPDAGATALREAVIRFLAARDADVDSPANLSAMDNLRLHDAHEAALAELRDVVRTIQETPRNAHH